MKYKVLVLIISVAMLIGCGTNTVAEERNQKLPLYSLGDAVVVEDIVTGDVLLEFSQTNGHLFYQPYLTKERIGSDPLLKERLKGKGYR